MVKNLLTNCPPVKFQGDVNNCYAKAATFAIEVIKRKYYQDERPYSDQYLNYTAHRIAGTEMFKPLAAKHIIQALKQSGVCLEEYYKYSVVDSFDEMEAPSPMADVSAFSNRIFNARELGSLKEIIKCLDGGYPIIGQYQQYASHFTERVENSGVINLPLERDFKSMAHAVCLVGYEENHFIFANSYGEKWGDGGFGKLPFEYVLQSLAGYFWTFMV